jgi:hypothetical protein
VDVDVATPTEVEAASMKEAEVDLPIEVEGVMLIEAAAKAQLRPTLASEVVVEVVVVPRRGIYTSLLQLQEIQPDLPLKQHLLSPRPPRSD